MAVACQKCFFFPVFRSGDGLFEGDLTPGVNRLSFPLTSCIIRDTLLTADCQLRSVFQLPPILREIRLMELKGNTILITGGTSGIGLAFAEKLAADNKIIICGRRKGRLEEISRRLNGIVTRVCDVSLDSDREDLARWVMDKYPETNVLINNAGVQLLANLTRPVDLTRIRQEVETNFIAPVHLSSLLVPHLAKKDNGVVVNISSGLAYVPLAFMPVYCATKAAIHSVTLSLRYQLKDSRVKVFEIAPPAVDTELGSDRRTGIDQTHGGMPVEEFIRQALEALRNDVLEAPIGTAAYSREHREARFEELNARFEPGNTKWS